MVAPTKTNLIKEMKKHGVNCGGTTMNAHMKQLRAEGLLVLYQNRNGYPHELAAKIGQVAVDQLLNQQVIAEAA